MRALLHFLRENPQFEYVRLRLVKNSPSVRARVRESKTAFELRNPGDISVALDYLNRNPDVVCIQLSLAEAGCARIRSLAAFGAETFENALIFDPEENTYYGDIFAAVLRNHEIALQELKRKLSRA